MTEQQSDVLVWIVAVVAVLVALGLVAGWVGVALGLVLIVALLGLGHAVRPREPR